MPGVIRRPRAVGRSGAAALLAAVLVVVGCEPVAPPPDAPPPAGWFRSHLTRDGGENLYLFPTADGVDVRPEATNGSSNGRVVFGRSRVPVGVDGTSCATATQSGWPVQEGVALRIDTDTLDGVTRTRAVTVTKNIYLMINWIYNVHVWDTSDPAQPRELVASIDLGAGVPDGDTDEVPRRLCARVTGRELEIKLWHPYATEPDWGDPTATTTLTLPPGWEHPGRPGWYAGHLPAGASLSLTDLVAESVPK